MGGDRQEHADRAGRAAVGGHEARRVGVEAQLDGRAAGGVAEHVESFGGPGGPAESVADGQRPVEVASIDVGGRLDQAAAGQPAGQAGRRREEVGAAVDFEVVVGVDERLDDLEPAGRRLTAAGLGRGAVSCLTGHHAFAG